MTRFAMFALVAGTLLLTACNDPNKKSSTMTTDDTSYSDTKSNNSNTYTPSNTYSSTPSNSTSSGSSSSGSQPMTYEPIYTTTTVTPGPGSSSTPGSYTTSSSSPPVTTTVISPAGSNTEMSDEELSPSGSTRSKSRSGGGQTYTVKSGDTLSKISKKMYGDSSKWNRIYNANKSTLANPNQLKVGTKLVIP